MSIMACTRFVLQQYLLQQHIGTVMTLHKIIGYQDVLWFSRGLQTGSRIAHKTVTAIISRYNHERKRDRFYQYVNNKILRLIFRRRVVSPLNGIWNLWLSWWYPSLIHPNIPLHIAGMAIERKVANGLAPIAAISLIIMLSFVSQIKRWNLDRIKWMSSPAIMVNNNVQSLPKICASSPIPCRGVIKSRNEEQNAHKTKFTISEVSPLSNLNYVVTGRNSFT